MRKHDWPALLKEQAVSGQTIAGFCDARGLTRSKFYAERAKQRLPKGLIPIRIQQPELLSVTVVLSGKALSLRGSGADLAQVLRCL
jgi:hypothetical protein